MTVHNALQAVFGPAPGYPWQLGCVQVNLALLEETGIAQHVARLRNHPDREVQQKAVAISQRWWRFSERARELAVLATEAARARSSPSCSPLKRRRIQE